MGVLAVTGAIALADAVICLETDCKSVFDLRLCRACPHCGSVEYMPIARWLQQEDAQAYEARTVDELKTLHAVNA